MHKKLSLPRDVMMHMLPLGTSVPCRVVASVILAVLTGASMAAPAGASDASSNSFVPTVASLGSAR
jgi:hypothetical protein